MKIILLKEVKNLGHAGEIKEVKEGYAINFLIAQGFADTVTKHSLNVLAARKAKLAKSKNLEVRSKKGLAKKINGQKYVITVKADDKGSLYAGLDLKAIAAELSKQKVVVEPGDIILKSPIKQIGEHVVELNLAGEKAVIKIEVKSEK